MDHGLNLSWYICYLKIGQRIFAINGFQRDKECTLFTDCHLQCISWKNMGFSKFLLLMNINDTILTLMLCIQKLTLNSYELTSFMLIIVFKITCIFRSKIDRYRRGIFGEGGAHKTHLLFLNYFWEIVKHYKTRM